MVGSITCGWCGHESEVEDFEGLSENPNVWDCDNCKGKNVAWLEVTIEVVSGGRYRPHKPAFCEHCNADLSHYIDVTSSFVSSLCQYCRKPVSIRVEREGVAVAD